jgi:hypothetical protein
VTCREKTLVLCSLRSTRKLCCRAALLVEEVERDGGLLLLLDLLLGRLLLGRTAGRSGGRSRRRTAAAARRQGGELGRAFLDDGLEVLALELLQQLLDARGVGLNANGRQNLRLRRERKKDYFFLLLFFSLRLSTCVFSLTMSAAFGLLFPPNTASKYAAM